MNSPLEHAIQIAHQVGDLLLSYFRRRDLDVKRKSDCTLVSEADVLADELITHELQHFSAAGILSEELDPIYEEQEDTVWVVDPLDGTTNFSLGLHIWGVSLARVSFGQPDVGVLYFPVLDELYTAQRGAGARLNDVPLQVNPEGVQGFTAFFSCCSRTHRKYQVDIPLKTRILGSAAYNLITVARGSGVLAFEATPKIWDIAAAWLVVQEAGGIMDAHGGSSPFPLKPGQDYRKISFPTFAAASPAYAQMARENIHLRTPSS